MPLRPLVISGNMLAVPASRQHPSCARRAFAQSHFTLKLLWTALNCSGRCVSRRPPQKHKRSFSRCPRACGEADRAMYLRCCAPKLASESIENGYAQCENAQVRGRRLARFSRQDIGARAKVCAVRWTGYWCGPCFAACLQWSVVRRFFRLRLYAAPVPLPGSMSPRSSSRAASCVTGRPTTVLHEPSTLSTRNAPCP